MSSDVLGRSLMLRFSFGLALLLGLNWKIQVSAAPGHCVSYGECGIKPGSDPIVHNNCPYNGPARPLVDPEALKNLRELCPDLVNPKGETLTCCDAKQVRSFYTGNLRIAQSFLKDCPACWYNFRRYYCAMTCSPQQSQFLHVLATKLETEGEFAGNESITSLQYYVTESFANQLYTSCANIQAGVMSAVSIMCEQWGDQCNGRRWLESMGSSPQAPVHINVTVTEATTVEDYGKNFSPLDLHGLKCSEPVEVNGPVCACSDCPEVCETTAPSFELPEPFSARFTIGSADGMTLIAVITYGVLVISFLLVVLGYRRKRTENEETSLRASRSSEDMNKDSTAQDSGLVEQKSMLTKRQSTVSHSDQVLVVEPTASWYQNLAYKFEDGVEMFFVKWGTLCATRPFVILSIGLVISSVLSLGLMFFTVVTDPVDLWAMPDSRARMEMEYFDSHFEPFYRTEQIIITPKNQGTFSYKNETFSRVFERDFLIQILRLQLRIESLTTKVDGQVVSLQDICYSPLAPENTNCTVFSVVNYFQNKNDLFSKQFDYLNHLRQCFRNPTNLACLAAYGGPVFPYLALGGFEGKQYTEAKALVLSFIVKNYYDKSKVSNAMAWEAEFIEFMKNYSNPNMEVYFLTSRSIQDEFERETHSDISTIAISYLIMFLYISIGLGGANNLKRLFIDSKVTLGLCGIFIVILSVMSSVGIFSMLGIPATLIVVEVVPFMVLAVGVDNIFILVQAYQRDVRKPNESREAQIGRVVGDVAPSMLLSSITDACGFFLGGLSSMPAVKTFALYAGTALIIAFILQISCFVSMFSLDVRRQEANRLDVCCFLHGSKKESHGPVVGLMYRLFKNVYAPFLMRPTVRICVVLTFLTWLCSSLAVINKIEVGLDQELSMPKDSYVMHYLESLKKYLAVGPPVYFVVKSGYNYSNLTLQNMICKGPLCDPESMLSQISYAHLHSERTYIAQEALSWLDDYTAWMSIGTCCKFNQTTGDFCPSTNRDCMDCEVPYHINGTTKRVLGSTFERYLPYFLKDNPSIAGCIGGHATYNGAVEYVNKSIGATHFMSFHTILKTSKDYYEALWWARYISDKITETLNNRFGGDGQTYEVFPYSFYYVFYEQYLTMWRDTMLNLLYSSICIFIMAFFLLGMDAYLSLIIVTAITMIVVNLMGMMYWWNIQLNAVSLVNLVVAIGIAVEFCSHITRAFAISMAETRILRTKDALINMGSSVLSGITLTKFTGIMVLAFAKSQIFQIFYFRINLCIVLFGAAHGLIFLPVILSYFGPPINKRRIRKQQQETLLRAAYPMEESESNS